MIRLRDVIVTYGRTRALDRVTLDVTRGEIIAIIGPNGSGKSTLLKAIAGLLRHHGNRETGGRAGYMPQDNGSRAALSVLETVLLGRLRTLGIGVSKADLAAATDLLSILGIVALAERTLAELSGGQRQLVFLAQALASEPAILLLDEPTSALDIRNALELCTVVRADAQRNARTVLVSMHDLNAAARFADRLIVLSEGRLIADGPPAEVLTPDVIRTVYHVDAERLTDRDGRPVLTFHPA